MTYTVPAAAVVASGAALVAVDRVAAPLGAVEHLITSRKAISQAEGVVSSEVVVSKDRIEPKLPVRAGIRP